MAAFPSFSSGVLEALAKAVGDCGSGSEISQTLSRLSISDQSGESTKWRRLLSVFGGIQSQDGCANRIVAFVQSFVAPARFIGRAEEFEAHRQNLNLALAFAGLKFGEDGQLRATELARTLPEAEARVQTLRSKFRGRTIHPEVLRFCEAELLVDNYFHALLEANKGLAQRIRDLSGVQLDGAALVDKVFSVQNPILAFNRLMTESERSEQTGYATLLKGCFGAIRNPLAHSPRLFWDGEEDAADILSMLSLLHRKLDGCVKVPG
jgi:uncharacterized protein (TIGR02391 family)